MGANEPSPPNGPPLESFSLCKGYDAEYEFTVDFFPNCIRWHLEFDKQWSDPDRDAVQSLADFLKNGPPSGFDLLEGEDGFRELALKLMGRAQ